MEKNTLNPFVRIKGNASRAAEVIAELEKRGGVNNYKYSGCDDNSWYYIDVFGIIGYTDKLSETMQNFFEEVSLPNVDGRWRASLSAKYYWLTDCGRVLVAVEAGDELDNTRFNAYNYFPTEDAAREAAARIVELLKSCGDAERA